MKPVIKTNLWIAAVPLMAPLALLTAPAQALPGFTYLDDEGEAGGYDVTAHLKSLPVEWSLNEQDNGDGYRLKINPNSIELSLIANKTSKTLLTYPKGIAPGTVVIQRHGPRWRLVAEKRVVLEVDDDTWSEGKIGFKGAASDTKVQPTDEVAFDDDFMRVASDVALAAAKDDPRKGVSVKSVDIKETVWTALAGTWNTTGLTENPEAQVAQTANPFVFKAGAKGTNLSVAGKTFWADYGAEVSVKPEGATAIGLAGYVQDAKNYLLMHWSEAGDMQLRGMVNGQMRVLDSMKTPFEQNQWYRLRLVAANGWVRGYLDDAEVLRSRTGLFGRGQVGLFAEVPAPEQSVVFDDVSVRSINDFADDFATVIPGRWRPVAGTWSVQGGLTSPAGGYNVMGEKEWTDYTASSQIQLPASAAAGVLLHHQVGKGSYLLRIAGSKAALPYAGRVQIVRVSGGKSEVLSEVPIGARFDGKMTEWAFTYERGYLKGEAGGTRLVDAFDDTMPAGRAGVFAQSDTKTKAASRFVEFNVMFPRQRPTWAKVPELYTEGNQPATMGGWALPEGLWVPLTPLASSTPGDATIKKISTLTDAKSFWHKGAFWGDGTVRFKLPKLTAEQKVDLVFGDPARISYVLTLRVNGQVLQANLSRATGGNATEVGKGQATLEGKMDGQTVEVARRGSFFILRTGEPSVKVLVAKVAR